MQLLQNIRQFFQYATQAEEVIIFDLEKSKLKLKTRRSKLN